MILPRWKQGLISGAGFMLMLRQFGGPHQFSGLVGASLVPSMERRLAAILIVDVVGYGPH